MRKAAAVTVGETADGDGNSLKEKSNAGYTPPLKRRVRKAIAEGGRAVGVKSKDNVRSNVKDALRIEMRPADADEDDDTSPAAGTASRRTGVTGGKSRRSHRRERKGDVEPPKPRVRSKVREGGGAEPGAGENFWQWFQETKGSEKKDVSNSVSCPEENMRLCLMFYKYIRKYKIRTIFDVSCGKNVHWMPDILKKVANELWGFKYYCGETDADALATAKEALGEQKFVEFVDDQWWRNGFPEDTELLFAWDTLPHIAYGRIWNFFVKARKQEIKYILVDNYPGILNDPVSSPNPPSFSTFCFHFHLLTLFAFTMCTVSKTQLSKPPKTSLPIPRRQGGRTKCHRARRNCQAATLVLRVLHVARQFTIAYTQQIISQAFAIAQPQYILGTIIPDYTFK